MNEFDVRLKMLESAYKSVLPGCCCWRLHGVVVAKLDDRRLSSELEPPPEMAEASNTTSNVVVLDWHDTSEVRRLVRRIRSGCHCFSCRFSLHCSLSTMLPRKVFYTPQASRFQYSVGAVA